ncbi:membrane protein DedA with SNARE-associated domain [Kribbella sp. VKM Ac-2527]|uniref:Membrane protein DedA with SNARE-associated domain n=1 Tax=Kribbella caucasensis TaxID=2512215 RepID=A0A4R6KIB8_9ACTN|nr:VTT domain-containing protein [Kribbella sp. VKM Ac-2527]TDO50022.1 membrane protein DedA with SNARE-associated domain [Kribbella sp. VKM Ac-2527]
MSGEPRFDLWYLVVLAGAVLLGAVLPVLPTGAAVSAGAVLASHSNPIGLVGVLIAGAGGAYLGDLIVYAGCRAGGEGLAKRIGWLRDNASLDVLRQRLAEREITVLLTSRLIPGGRVPVLLAAGLAGYPWQRFALVDLTASSLWAAVYMAIGLLGYALFDEPWQGVVAAIVLVLLTTVISSVVQRIRRRRKEAGGPSGEPVPDAE